MKPLPTGLQAHLNSGCTTLCLCWKITRLDGAVFGFTDHDVDIVFGGLTYEAATGFTASEIRDSVGMNVDNLDVEGALVSTRLSEADLAAGLFDDARVEIWLVNWSAVAQRVMLRRGSLGEVKRGPAAFVAEVRGMAHYLNQEKGRLFQYACDAEIGDARCGLNLAAAGLSGAGAVTSAASAWKFQASGLDAFASGRFSGGLVRWTSGANAGRVSEILTHNAAGAAAAFELWERAAGAIAAGDAFTVSAGCDKTFPSCKAFANAANYRGFPHMPGVDFLLSVPNSRDGGYDGHIIKE